MAAGAPHFHRNALPRWHFRGGGRKKMLGVGQSWARHDQNIISDHDEPKIAPNRAHGGSRGLMEVVSTPTVSHGTHLTVVTLVLR